MINSIEIMLVTTAARIAKGNACHMFISYQVKKLITNTPTHDAIEPAERSKPPTARVKVSPMAIIVVTEIERKIVVILLGIRNVSGILMIKNNATTIKAITDPQLDNRLPKLNLEIFDFIRAATFCILLPSS